MGDVWAGPGQSPDLRPLTEVKPSRSASGRSPCLAAEVAEAADADRAVEGLAVHGETASTVIHKCRCVLIDSSIDLNTAVVAMLIFRLATYHDGLSACGSWRIATHTSSTRNEWLPLRS